MDIDNKKYYCKFCNYGTNYSSDWIKHSETAKHLRLGKKINHKCNQCEYESHSHWNLKLHNLSKHSEQKDREKSKYYCKTCDQVFFSELFYNKHIFGKKHLNVVRAIKIQEDLNEL
jgi:hypothetical protein